MQDSVTTRLNLTQNNTRDLRLRSSARSHHPISCLSGKGDWRPNAGYMLGTKSVWSICAVTEAAGSFLVFVVSLLSGENNLWPTGPKVFLFLFFFNKKKNPLVTSRNPLVTNRNPPISIRNLKNCLLSEPCLLDNIPIEFTCPKKLQEDLQSDHCCGSMVGVGVITTQGSGGRGKGSGQS